MWTFPAAEDAPPCLKLTLELLETWVSGGVTAEEIAFIKGYLVGSHAFDIDTATKRMHQALDEELLGLPVGYHRTWTDKVTAVTPEQASDAVKRRLDPERLLAVVVGTAAQVLEPLRGAVPRLSEVAVVPFDAE
jgi:zinc protease